MHKDRFIRIVKPHTMTSEERIAALFDGLEHVRRNHVPGDIVECGTWKGGNILGCLEYLQSFRMAKTVWLYDTFRGMPPVGEHDVDLHGKSGRVWEGDCRASLEEVKRILSRSEYPQERIRYVEGDVTRTLRLKGHVPESIALLRLDTDWYASTRVELDTLYPALANRGVLIIDDYGHWQGARRATDEYFEQSGIKPRFHWIDYTGVSWIKGG
jgi:O-methyltransferase